MLVGELEALERALAKPARPLVAIVAGSKVSTKLTVLESLLGKVDKLIVGGGIANTFMLAAGLPIGKSLAEPGLVEDAKAVIAAMAARGAEVPIPVDVVVAKVAGAYLALEDACNHAGASLATGSIDRGCIVCPLHNYRFDMATGKLVSPRGLCADQPARRQPSDPQPRGASQLPALRGARWRDRPRAARAGRQRGGRHLEPGCPGASGGGSRS